MSVSGLLHNWWCRPSSSSSSSSSSSASCLWHFYFLLNWVLLWKESWANCDCELHEKPTACFGKLSRMTIYMYFWKNWHSRICLHGNIKYRKMLHVENFSCLLFECEKVWFQRNQNIVPFEIMQLSFIRSADEITKQLTSSSAYLLVLWIAGKNVK